jgi:hypothetical protein
MVRFFSTTCLTDSIKSTRKYFEKVKTRVILLLDKFRYVILYIET